MKNFQHKSCVCLIVHSVITMEYSFGLANWLVNNRPLIKLNGGATAALVQF